jgi:hypothetical protein
MNLPPAASTWPFASRVDSHEPIEGRPDRGEPVNNSNSAGV